MALILIKVPGEKTWVEYDNVTGLVTNIYNKPEITADIQSLNASIALRPDPSLEASDVADLLTAIEGKWTVAKRTRIVALVNQMWQEHQGSMQEMETAQMIAKRDALVELRSRLV